ncbi:T9SS type B sorting domain-containing protein [Aequorivita sp. H23M31]|uniref:T9SS type B sorting domain-containing protein n=1 Tax=Aequorivita ciconiae TaxID=2494375 RepID=A0A410G6N5_9FLAO|nr:T9SS type B sorting domain-containing protein [Aequorivita sp. H23M31]QAA82881.1 T9SS type B sorting domain-containing protein [Aequorivita sp. H23M31]
MSLKLTFLLVLFAFSAFSQNPNDCVNAIVICGNSSLGIEPDGIGFDEFSLPGNFVPPCYSMDQHNIWFKFEFLSSGTFTFDLSPDNGMDDYDFAIFGPNVTCTSLGHAIRCSSTNPENAGVPADTGLNMTETDTEEGPGEDGNGYLKYIDVQAGEVYYLIVDRAQGSGPFSIFYTGTAQLPNSVTANQPNNLIKCDTDGRPDEQTNFNLESQTNIIIGNQTGVAVSYHKNLNDASIGVNPLSSPYRNTTNPQTIYARIERPNGCSDITSFELEIGNPRLQEPEDVVLCSFEESETYVLDNIIPEIIGNPNGYIFSFHNAEEDAINNLNPIGRVVDFTFTPRRIFVRVTDELDENCFSITSFWGYLNRIEKAGQPTNIVVCDFDLNGKTTIYLNDKDVEILNARNPLDFEILYFTSESDRLAGINSISGRFQTTQNPQIIYVRFLEKATGCFDYTQFRITVNPLPLPRFNQDPYLFCLNATEALPISVERGFKYYVWNTGEEGRSLNRIYINDPGIYSVTVTNEYGCTNTVSVEVLPSDIATITDLEIFDFHGKDNSVIIMVEGLGDYEFAVDTDLQFQNDNFFRGLSNGFHTAYVRDKNGCGIVSREFLILDYPRFFTPNNDGVNDYWRIIGIDQIPDFKIYIFDRFGKLLKRIPPYSLGWDGTNLKGKKMPSNDYWFLIDLANRPQYRGHFTLKR